MATVGAFVGLMADLLRPVGRLGFLVNFILVSLLGISAAATAIGILHLARVDATGRGLLGMLLVLIGTIVITLLMWVMLERSRLPGTRFARSACAAFYGFLFLWAVGFGYGYWWEAIASRQASEGRIELVLQSLRNGLVSASSKLEVADVRMTSLIRASQLRADRENTEGSSCGAQSGVGRGPLWGARSRVNDEIRAKAEELRNGWLGPARAQLGEAQGLVTNFNPPATAAARDAAFTALYQSATESADRINALSASAAGPLARDLGEIARKLRIPPGSPDFQCYDPTLAGFLETTATIIRTPVRLEIGEWTSVEGNGSTEEAFLRLWGTMSSAVGPNVTGKSMVGRDWIALLAAIAVDIGILVLTLVRPRPGGQTFMGNRHADSEALGQVEHGLNRHRSAAQFLFYEFHFALGRRQYIAIPDMQWTGPPGFSPREFHVALGTLAPRLAASRRTSPSSKLLASATERLNRSGWSPPKHRGKEETNDGWRAWLRRLARGSVLPYQPLIYEIGEQDRNLAIRLLDEPADGKRRLRGLRERVAEMDIPGAPDDEASPKPDDAGPAIDSSWVKQIYAAAVSQRARGLAAEADGLLHILRSELPKLNDLGIEVLGLDDVAGKPFDPSSPFIVVDEIASSKAKGNVVEVTALAIAYRTPKGRVILNDGHVILSAGRKATGTKVEDYSTGNARAASSDDVLLDPEAWMPGSDD